MPTYRERNGGGGRDRAPRRRPLACGREGEVRGGGGRDGTPATPASICPITLGASPQHAATPPRRWRGCRRCERHLPRQTDHLLHAGRARVTDRKRHLPRPGLTTPAGCRARVTGRKGHLLRGSGDANSACSRTAPLRTALVQGRFPIFRGGDCSFLSFCTVFSAGRGVGQLAARANAGVLSAQLIDRPPTCIRNRAKTQN